MAAFVCLLSARPARAAGSVTCSAVTAAGVPLKVITIPLENLDIKVTGQMPKWGAGHAEPFGQMIRRTRPAVAVTGTFFSTRTLKPIGDIVIGGQLAHFGGLGTALCITDNNEVEFIRPERYRHQDWSRFDFVLCSGPRLVRGGMVAVDPRSEGFRDRRLFQRAARLAIGATRDRRLVIVATRKPVHLSRLARAMRAIGVVDAINLDGGSSLGLYCRGKMLMRPGRWLTNLLVVYEDRWHYENVRESLLPIEMRQASSR